jgi:hypothetical protein
VRRDGDLWAVGAVAIEITELPADRDGEELMLTVNDLGELELVVDGRPSAAGAEALADVVGTRYDAYVLRARRIAGSFWEVTVDPL